MFRLLVSPHDTRCKGFASVCSTRCWFGRHTKIKKGERGFLRPTGIQGTHNTVTKFSKKNLSTDHVLRVQSCQIPGRTWVKMVYNRWQSEVTSWENEADVLRNSRSLRHLRAMTAFPGIYLLLILSIFCEEGSARLTPGASWAHVAVCVQRHCTHTGCEHYP